MASDLPWNSAHVAREASLEKDSPAVQVPLFAWIHLALLVSSSCVSPKVVP